MHFTGRSLQKVQANDFDMAWRPERLVESGELDNTQLGWTVGWLELDGIDQRLQLKLVGNCHPDLAGWKFRIHRVEAELPDEDQSPNFSGISLDQSGHVGDITADQMIKHHEMPNEELVRRLIALTQGNVALESQAVSRASAQSHLEEAKARIASSSRKLWAS